MSFLNHHFIDLFRQTIIESGTILTCYEDSAGPTNKNFKFAETTCNYTQEMWDSGNFGPLKECLMKIDVLVGEGHANVRIPVHCLKISERRRLEFRLLEHGSGQLFRPRKSAGPTKEPSEHPGDDWHV